MSIPLVYLPNYTQYNLLEYKKEGGKYVLNEELRMPLVGVKGRNVK